MEKIYFISAHFGDSITASEILIPVISLILIFVLYRTHIKSIQAKKELDITIEKILESIDEIPLDVSPDGQILRYREKFLSALGYDLEKDAPKNIFDAVHNEDRHVLMSALDSCLDSEKWGRLLGMRFFHYDGGILFFNISLTKIGGGAEKKPFCKLILKNITELRTLSARLKEKEALWDSIVKQTPDGVLILENARIVFANHSFGDIVARKTDEIIGKGIRDFIYPESLEKFDVWASDQAILGSERWLYDTRLADIAGNPVPVELDFTALPFGDKKQALMVVRDISDIEKPIETTTDEKFRLLFENANDAIFFSDPSGKIVQFNPAAETLCGYDRQELSDMSFHELFDMEDRELALRQLAWVRRGNRVHFEARFLSADGKRIDVDISASLVYSGGEELMISIVRDIAERKQFLSRISQTQKIESLGIMAGGVANNFNNILEGIIGAADLAKRISQNNQELISYINLISKSAQKGANLTKHLLNYARSSGIEFEIIDLNSVITDCAELLTQTLDKRIHLRLEKADDLSPIWGDPEKLKQAIVNLAINAQEAMPQGGEISIRTRNFSVDERFAIDHLGISPGSHIEITIQDTGVGIPKEISSKIFDPFFTTKEKGEGTGLGLSIVQSIVRSHSGAIDVKSVINEGTSIKIYLPTISAMVESFEGPSELDRESTAGKRIMVIDDEEIIQAVLKGILEQLGYLTIQARTGKEGIELLTAGNEVDAILLDMVMPGLSGWETYRYLRTYWPRIPVVVITGYANQEQIRVMLEDGLAGIVEKPFRAGQIAEKLKKVLRKDI